jgi:class 3 adenylate cyclase
MQYPGGAEEELSMLFVDARGSTRLASSAGPGEALISEAAYGAASLDLGKLEQRQLELKGKSDAVGEHVFQLEAG